MKKIACLLLALLTSSSYASLFNSLSIDNNFQPLTINKQLNQNLAIIAQIDLAKNNLSIQFICDGQAFAPIKLSTNQLSYHFNSDLSQGNCTIYAGSSIKIQQMANVTQRGVLSGHLKINSQYETFPYQGELITWRWQP